MRTLVSTDEWLYGRWHEAPESVRDFGPKLRRTSHGVRHWCPACRGQHHIAIFKANPLTQADWRWDGDIERPTFDPCIRASINVSGNMVTLCHYWIRKGFIHFSEQCPHELAGRIVELPDWPIVSQLEAEARKARSHISRMSGATA